MTRISQRRLLRQLCSMAYMHLSQVIEVVLWSSPFVDEPDLLGASGALTSSV